MPHDPRAMTPHLRLCKDVDERIEAAEIRLVLAEMDLDFLLRVRDLVYAAPREAESESRDAEE